MDDPNYRSSFLSVRDEHPKMLLCSNSVVLWLRRPRATTESYMPCEELVTDLVCSARAFTVEFGPDLHQGHRGLMAGQSRDTPSGSLSALRGFFVGNSTTIVSHDSTCQWRQAFIPVLRLGKTLDDGQVRCGDCGNNIFPVASPKTKRLVASSYLLAVFVKGTSQTIRFSNIKISLLCRAIHF